MAEIHNVESLIEQSNLSLLHVENRLESTRHSTQCVGQLATRILDIIRGMKIVRG
jgi:hypothetical protein